MIEKLKILGIVEDSYAKSILDRIYTISDTIYNKNDTIKVKVIGLSTKEMIIKLNIKDLYLPIFTYIFKIINNDIKKNFNANCFYESFKYNYYRSINLYINDISNEKLSVYHILMKHNFDYINDTLIIYFNEIGLTHNYDKTKLIPVCPVTLDKITVPYICKTCNNSFEKTDKLIKLKKCPMCRCEKFSKNFINDCMYGVKNRVTDTLDIYFYEYLTSSELLTILYKLELWFYNQGDDYIMSKETVKNIEQDFNNRNIGLTREEIISKINQKLNNIYIAGISTEWCTEHNTPLYEYYYADVNDYSENV
jgi:predicted  nucleic acid-binding Zn-ribbon protein